MAQATLSVPDISCAHCELMITEALSLVEGVKSVKVDIPAKSVRVGYDEHTVDVDRFKAILQEADYPVAAVS